MKALKLITVVSIVVFMASCADLFNLAKVTLHPGFNVQIDANLPDSTIKSVNFHQTLDIAADSIIDKYKDHLESLSITAVKIKVLSYTGPAGNKFNGELQYSDPTSTTGIPFATITNMDVNDLFLTGNEFTVTLNTAETQKFADKLIKDFSVTVYVSGSVDSAPFQATFMVHFDTELKAKAL